MPIRILLFLLCLLPLSATAASAPPATDRIDRDLVAAINAVRLVEQRPLLRRNPKLAEAAAAHAADMAQRGYFSHKDPEGRGLGFRLTRVGYPFALALETIAAGGRDPQLVLARWLDSPEHKRILLNRNVRDIGVAHLYYASDPAVSRDRHYWVVVLGLAADPANRDIANAKKR